MTWYNDQEPSAGPPAFGAAPPGAPASPVPPTGGGDVPTTPSSGSNRTVLLVVTVVGALLAMMTVGAGAFLLLSNRTEELSMGDYAEKMCEEAIEPRLEEVEEWADAEEWEDLKGSDETFSRKQGRLFLQFMTEFTDHFELLTDDIESFNAGHRLRGPDGDDLFDELNDMIDESRHGVETLREELRDADPSDIPALSERFDKLGESASTYALSDSDIGAELNEELAEVNEDCKSVGG